MLPSPVVWATMRHNGPATVSLMYHDVWHREAGDAAVPKHQSGFRNPGAELYKLSSDSFAAHLRAIGAAGSAPTTVSELHHTPRARLAVTLTFDDGGSSAHQVIAPLLEEMGWRGHFFVPTDFIGTTGFMDAEQLVDLSRRGHVVGSHSCSHPEIMSNLDGQRLRHEWTRSREVLADILGHEVTVASVPNGYSSPAVVAAAASAGIECLFTSEPSAVPTRHGNCLVLGRYSVQTNTSTRAVADLVRRPSVGRAYQALSWGLKKAVKAAAGDRYLALRATLLRARSS